jgi:hypothetical protein
MRTSHRSQTRTRCATPSRRLLVVTAAASLMLLAGTTLAQTPVDRRQGQQASAQAQAGQTVSLPLRAVTLYRSGVGSFTIDTKVRGNQTVTMQFSAQQVNDILKSLVVLDMDGGTVGAITYDSNQPLVKRLEMYGINIAGGPSLQALLSQLIGERVVVDMRGGSVEGTIVSVEQRRSPVSSPSGESMVVMDRLCLNLWTPTGLRQVALDEMQNFRLTNQALAEDITRALATLADFRAERRTNMDVELRGAGDRERRVVISYTHEMPVWKTSYRLVLNDSTGSAAVDSKGVPSGRALVQGWAIVENTTDQDWNDIRLSLASGRPVSFTMNLHQSLFVDRPELPVPGFSVVSGGMYKSGMPVSAPPAPSMSAGVMGRERAVTAQARSNEMMMDAAMDMSSMGAAQSVGEEVGGQFLYTVEAPVSIPRGQSSMLPILLTEIPARQVSIFNPSTMPKHPMKGVEMLNASGLHLMPGPVAIYDGNTYAGDAEIAHTSRNQSRLVQFALDIDVFVEQTTRHEQRTSAMRIVDGLLEHTTKSVATTTYTFRNYDAKRDRTIILEHTQGMGWKLVTPAKPKEVSDGVYRFEVTVPRGGSIELPVAFEQTHSTTLRLMTMTAEEFLSYTTNAQASPEVIQAAREAARLSAAFQEVQRQVTLNAQRLDEMYNEQRRIRENLSRVGNESDLRERYLTLLSEKENEILALDAERERLRKDLAARETALREYLRGLTIN